MTTGVIIGRFQVPYLHLGHIHLITTALMENEEVVILLGYNTSKKPDNRNPYSVSERKMMIRKLFPHIQIYPLIDRSSDEEWSNDIDGICDILVNPILYHSRDSFKDSYKGIYPLKEVPELPGYSGTKLRNKS